MVTDERENASPSDHEVLTTFFVSSALPCCGDYQSPDQFRSTALAARYSPRVRQANTRKEGKDRRKEEDWISQTIFGHVIGCHLRGEFGRTTHWPLR